MPWRSADLDFALGAPMNRCSVFTLSPMKTVTLWKTKMNLEEGFVSFGEPFSKHVSKTRDITNLRISYGLFRKAPGDIRWTTDKTEFDELIAMKKDSAPGPDGIPYGASRCAGGLGSHFLNNA